MTYEIENLDLSIPARWTDLSKEERAVIEVARSDGDLRLELSDLKGPEGAAYLRKAGMGAEPKPFVIQLTKAGFLKKIVERDLAALDEGTRFYAWASLCGYTSHMSFGEIVALVGKMKRIVGEAFFSGASPDDKAATLEAMTILADSISLNASVIRAGHPPIAPRFAKDMREVMDQIRRGQILVVRGINRSDPDEQGQYSGMYRSRGMNGKPGVLQLGQEYTAATVVHESLHGAQDLRGNPQTGFDREMESYFAEGFYALHAGIEPPFYSSEIVKETAQEMAEAERDFENMERRYDWVNAYLDGRILPMESYPRAVARDYAKASLEGKSEAELLRIKERLMRSVRASAIKGEINLLRTKLNDDLARTARRGRPEDMPPYFGAAIGALCGDIGQSPDKYAAVVSRLQLMVFEAYRRAIVRGDREGTKRIVDLQLRHLLASGYLYDLEGVTPTPEDLRPPTFCSW